MLAVGVTFARAAVHKRAEWDDAAAHPMVGTFSVTRAHPRAALAVAGAVELAGLVLLLLAPVWGIAILLGLLLVYTYGVTRLPAEQSCNCFGSSPDSTRSDALTRNAGLLLVLTACLAVACSGTAVDLVAPTPVALATLLLAPFAGSLTLNYVANSLRPRGAPNASHT